jgi:transcriptional regulator with XRE-family HTH domain
LNAEKLRLQMNTLKITVADVALISGTTRRAVEKWRSGEHPPPKLLDLILTALIEQKIDLEWVADVLYPKQPQ